MTYLIYILGIIAVLLLCVSTAMMDDKDKEE